MLHSRKRPGQFGITECLAQSLVLGQGAGATALTGSATTLYALAVPFGVVRILQVAILAFAAGTFTGNGRVRVVRRNNQGAGSNVVLTDWFNLTSAGITVANQFATYRVPFVSTLSPDDRTLRPGDGLYLEAEVGTISAQPNRVQAAVLCGLEEYIGG